MSGLKVDKADESPKSEGSSFFLERVSKRMSLLKIYSLDPKLIIFFLFLSFSLFFFFILFLS